MSQANPKILELPVRAQSADRETNAECVEQWRRLGLTDRPRARWFPRPAVQYAATVAALFDVVEDDSFDAVLFADERRHSPMHNLRDVVGALQAPIIDLSGRAGKFADAHFDRQDRNSWDDTAKAILGFRERRAQLGTDFAASVEAEKQLLAHAFVSGREMVATRYPLAAEAIAYPGFCSAARTVPAAESLVVQGLLTKRFFDRVHVCSNCESRRLTVREECPSCRSADLGQTTLIHHYHCAALLPEDQFRQGAVLVCPKCSQHLRNYGKDYDKPGQAQACRHCAEVTSEPSVGFVCLDCGAHADGDGIQRTDVFSYTLTDRAVELLKTETKLPAVPGLPSTLIGELNRMASEKRSAVALAEVKYGARNAIVGSKGEPTFDRLRRLFLENMTNYLAESGTVHSGDAADYILLANYDERLEDQMQALMSRSEALLNAKLEPELRLSMRSQGTAP